MKKLLDGQNILNTLDNLDITKILYNLSEITYKNQFSQAKNAFLYFLECYGLSLNENQKQILNQLQENTHKKYRKLKKVSYEDIDRKIKHLRNQKLKLCYQVLLNTGLRVSELSQITSADCTISDTNIILNFIGKGGKREQVAFYKKDNEKLYTSLVNHIKTTPSVKKLFYSANYLQTNAKKLGFGCHDLRRTYAKLEYRKTKSIKETQEKLRHTNIKNTYIYLNSKVKL